MSLEDLMRGLKSEYLAELPAKIALIEKHCVPEHLEQLREDFHKLKGTGKTYGVPEISILAEVVEQMVIQNPGHALKKCEAYLGLLRDIHTSRLKDQEFPVSSDPRFLQLKQN